MAVVMLLVMLVVSWGWCRCLFFICILCLRSFCVLLLLLDLVQDKSCCFCLLLLGRENLFIQLLDVSLDFVHACLECLDLGGELANSSCQRLLLLHLRDIKA